MLVRGSAGFTCIVGLCLQYVYLGAVGQPVVQTDVQEAGLRPRDTLQQRQQRHRLLTLVPALKPVRQDPHLVPEHHGQFLQGRGRG